MGVMLLMMSVIVSAAPRSVKEAANIAASFQNEQAQKAGLHRAPRKAADMQLIREVAKPESSEAALYVFNNSNGGWVIVSADDNAVTILGYSDNGTFDTNNSSAAFMLDYYAERIAKAQPLTDEQKAKRRARKAIADEIDTTHVDPLLEIEGIRWDQGKPYNGMCPMDRYTNSRSITGCAATATSQILRYWKWPAQGRGSFSYTWQNTIDIDADGHTLATFDTVLTINYGESTYDWDNMLPQYISGQYTQEQGRAVAQLMNHAGVGGMMHYSSANSGAYINDIGSAILNNFRYKCEDYHTMWHNEDLTYDSVAKLFSIDLHNNRPILMSGTKKKGGAHAFVCDGMKVISGHVLFHINWGWSGGSDGYFVISALDSHNSGLAGANSEAGYKYDIDFLHALEPDKNPIHVSEIALNNTNLNINAGSKTTLKATVTPADATCKGIYWTSSNEKVATVQGYGLCETYEVADKPWDGVVTGISAGTATINAVSYDGDIVASCEVTVVGENAPASIDTTELVFTKVYERKHEVGSKHVSIGLQGAEADYYPYISFKLAIDTLNWKIAGHYELGDNNIIKGWITEAMYNLSGHPTVKSVSGWLNITCVANGQYNFDGVYFGSDNNYYKVNYTASISTIKTKIDESTEVKHTLTDQAQEVKWYALGEEFAHNYAVGDQVVLPNGQPEACSNGRVFVGWSASELEATNIKPALVKNGDKMNSSANYYAVYAERASSNATTEIASVKFNHYSCDDDSVSVADQIDSLMAYDNFGFKEISGTNTVIGKNGVKLGASGKIGWLTLTFDQPINLKKVVVNASPKENENDCRIRVMAGTTMVGNIQAPAANMEYIANQSIETNSIKIAINEQHAYIDKITVFTDEAGTYSNYGTACDGEGSELPVIIMPINKEGLILTQNNISLDIAESMQLAYTITPYDTHDQSVTWESSDANIATIDANGNVTGVAVGTATITVTAVNGGYSATCEVSVNEQIHQNILNFTKVFDNSYNTDKSRFSIGLEGPEGGYYPYMWLLFNGNTTDWKIAGEYNLDDENYITGWPTEAQYNMSGHPTVKSVSGWMKITCVGAGKYNFQGQYMADNGIEYIFDYTTDLSAIKKGNETYTLTDHLGAPVYFVSMGDTIASTLKSCETLVLPTEIPVNCTSMSFMGWTAEENYNSDIAPTLAQSGDSVSDYAVYYAVFALQDGDPMPFTETASIVFADVAGSENAATPDAVEWYDDQYLSGKNKEDLIDSKYNISNIQGYSLRAGEHGVRIGSSSKDEYGYSYDGWIQLDLEQETTVTKVVTTFSKTRSNDLGVLYITLGDVYDSNPISEGEDVEYIPTTPVTTYTVTLSTAAKAEYIKSIKIYTGGQSFYKNYTTTTCYDPISTAIENNGEKANGEWTKMIKNGQLYIIKDGVMYNVLGAKVK